MTEGDIATAGSARTYPQPKTAAGPLRTPAASRRLVVVSNRVAVDTRKPDSGGLAVAIQAALETSGGIWFGWSGKVEDTPSGELTTLAADR